MRAEALPGAEQVERFTADWEPLSLSNDFDAGDCELVEMLCQQVFPKLSVRVLNRIQHCPSSGFYGLPRLKVIALLPRVEDQR